MKKKNERFLFTIYCCFSQCPRWPRKSLKKPNSYSTFGLSAKCGLSALKFLLKRRTMQTMSCLPVCQLIGRILGKEGLFLINSMFCKLCERGLKKVIPNQTSQLHDFNQLYIHLGRLYKRKRLNLINLPTKSISPTSLPEWCLCTVMTRPQ